MIVLRWFPAIWGVGMLAVAAWLGSWLVGILVILAATLGLMDALIGARGAAQ
jgi:hypothetical protein